jgi:hypothetical protein
VKRDGKKDLIGGKAGIREDAGSKPAGELLTPNGYMNREDVEHPPFFVGNFLKVIKREGNL